MVLTDVLEWNLDDLANLIYWHLADIDADDEYVSFWG